jgi:hypothetical protein
MRFVRLSLGIAIVVQSVMAKDWAMGILGIFFTSLPVLNIGCCSTGGCATTGNVNKVGNKEITYEEVV